MKKVNFVIQVPEGDYCWNGKSVCDHFDNIGGHPTCDLGFFINRESKKNNDVKKDKNCLTLKGVNDGH